MSELKSSFFFTLQCLASVRAWNATRVCHTPLGKNVKGNWKLPTVLLQTTKSVSKNYLWNPTTTAKKDPRKRFPNFAPWQNHVRTHTVKKLEKYVIQNVAIPTCAIQRQRYNLPERRLWFVCCWWILLWCSNDEQLILLIRKCTEKCEYDYSKNPHIRSWFFQVSLKRFLEFRLFTFLNSFFFLAFGFVFTKHVLIMSKK